MRDFAHVAVFLASDEASFMTGAVVPVEAGHTNGDPARLERQFQLAGDNVAWAADQAAAVGCQVMIEAVNSMENGPYLLTSTAPRTAGLPAHRGAAGRPADSA